MTDREQEDVDRIDREIDKATDENGDTIPPKELIAEERLRKDREERFAREVFSINRFPDYIPEEQNPNILIKGRWLERGGSAWWISTAGTGKSIASIQLAYSWGAGIPFGGLTPYRPLKSWIIQSEDSPSRIVIDREDITAELAEQRPDINWKEVAETQVNFIRCDNSLSGVAFFKEMDRMLATAEEHNALPDYIIINPFLAFVGGPVTDGSYVTPFLRGGIIQSHESMGLQHLLERYNIGALIFHHTPKPPTEKEIAAWLKSTFPEYQGAGSSDITNWGRSFITMMKCPGHPRVVCLCAGKNGSEIGWEQIGGSTRRYLAWSDGVSITGGRRHAWRELNDEERAEIVEKQQNEAEKNTEGNANTLAEAIRESGNAYKKSELENKFKSLFSNRGHLRDAIRAVLNNPSHFHLFMRERKDGRNKAWYISASLSTIDTTSMHDQESERKRIQYEQTMTEQREREKAAKTANKPIGDSTLKTTQPTATKPVETPNSPISVPVERINEVEQAQSPNQSPQDEPNNAQNDETDDFDPYDF